MPVTIPATRVEATALTAGAVRLFVLLLVFTACDRWFTGRATGATRDDDTSFLAWTFVGSFGWQGVVLAGLLALGVLRGGCLRLQWSDLPNGTTLKWLVVLCVALLAWNFATTARNFFTGQSYYLDRLLLVAGTFAVLHRPWFTLPFLVVLLPFRAQFSHPIGGYFMAETLPIVAVVSLTGIRLALCPLLGRKRCVSDVLILALCALAACFFVPGTSKLHMGWLWHNQSHLLPMNAYARGWASWVSAEHWLALQSLLASIEWPARVGVILLEAGAAFILVHRRTAILALCAWLAFMTGLAAIIGYVFLYWFLLTAALAFLIGRRTAAPSAAAADGTRAAPVIGFGVPLGALGAATIMASPIWLRPANLAWFDTPVSYAYELHATTGDAAPKDHLQLAPRFFRPFSDAFTMAGFEFLVDAPSLVSPYGITGSTEILEALRTANSAEDIFLTEASLGRELYRERWATRFDAFVRRFVSHYQASGGKRGWFASLHPPEILNAMPRDAVTDARKRITAVEVVQVTWFFDGTELRDIRRRTIRTIQIQIP